MKTLREYLDQLDEISRRDFLKGAGATAGLAAVGAPKDAEAQTTNYVQLANYATQQANQIITSFSSVMMSERRSYFSNYTRENIYNQTMWYLNNTNGHDAEEVINYGLMTAKKSAEDLPTTPGDFIGGGGLRDNVAMKVVNIFVQTYASAMKQNYDKFARQNKQQQQQKQALGGLSESEVSALTDALLLYAITKEDNHPSHKQIAQAVGKFIQAYNNKDYVNSMYAKVKPSLDQVRSNPNLFAQEKNNFYKRASSIISNLNSLSDGKQPEFKESEELDETSDDAIKRIEELTKYK
jgi:hypothetical protein